MNGKILNPQDIKSEHLISVLSKMDNYRVFIAAKDGIKYSPRVVEEMGLSRKRYYNALSQLNRHGLTRRDLTTGRSIYTVFGEMIYRCISEMNKYAEHIEELRMIDALKQTGEFTSDRIMKFLEMVSDDEKIARNISGTFDVVWSHKAMVDILLDHIGGASSEILVATRMISEDVIRVLRAEAALGVKVQILSDTPLIESYFAMHGISRVDNQIHTDKPERTEVVGNTLSPEMRVERRIANFPFGMIIIDAREVGIELVDANNLTEFFAGLIVQDMRVAEAMKNYFERLWAQSQECAGFYEGRNTDADTAA